jgi:hypothetical protein
MIGRLQLILDWSEVWALLIPLFVLGFRKSQPAYLKPIIVYLWIALLLNVLSDIISELKSGFPSWLHWLRSNNVLYNIHSLIRFALFTYFFRLLGKRFRSNLDKFINIGAFVFLVINFSFIENFFNPDNLSGNLLATEAFILLVYCMQYYLSKLRDETEEFSRTKDFWIVTGLSIYVVINFFVFLFYVPLLSENPGLSIKMWYVHNVAYIVLCIFIARAFYVPA